jgi:hypothetical protein
MDGWREAGTSIPPCGCAGPRGVGPKSARPTAPSVAPRSDLEGSSSGRRPVDVVARTGRIGAQLAGSRSTPLRSGISVCSSRWMSAACARKCALMTTRRHRRDGPGLQRLAGSRRVPHSLLNRPAGVGGHVAGLSRPRVVRAPAGRVGALDQAAACGWIRGWLDARSRGCGGRTADGWRWCCCRRRAPTRPRG